MDRFLNAKIGRLLIISNNLKYSYNVNKIYSENAKLASSAATDYLLTNLYLCVHIARGEFS